MNDSVRSFGQEASRLAELLGENPQVLLEAHEAAAQLRGLLPLEADAAERLALVLETPLALASSWAERTAQLWDDAVSKDALSDDVADLVASRLAVLGWAFGSPPASWNTELEGDISEAWEREERAAFGEPAG